MTEGMMTTSAPQTCCHCGRSIVKDENGRWVDPEATGDDSVWRETCDEHDTFTAEHEPVEPDDELVDVEVTYKFVVSVQPGYQTVDVAEAVRGYINGVGFALDEPESVVPVSP